MSWDFQTVAVVGSGAIGIYYGARLAASGKDVRFLLRSDFDAVMRDGIRLDSVHGDLSLRQVQGFSSPAEIGPVDLVIVAWKATSNHLLENVLPPLLHPGTQVLTLQNGLGNCEHIARICGEDRVLGGLCFVCCNRVGPGHVRHSAGGKVAVGEFFPGTEGRAVVIATTFKQARVPASLAENLHQAQWEKLVWNIPFNGLSVAMGGISTEQILADSGSEARVARLMIEVVHAARAQGLALDDSLVSFNIERTRPMGPYRTSSMIDFIEGREVEVDNIWRIPCQRARTADCPMPEAEQVLGEIEAAIQLRDEP